MKKNISMKKTLLLSMALCVMVYAQAQTIIPRLGITMSNIAYAEDDGEKAKMGLTLGAGFNFEVNEMLSVQPELNFIQKGVKYDEDQFEQKVTLNYLEIPVLVKLTFGDATKFFVNVGPSLGFGLSGKYKGEDDGESFDGKIKFGKEPDNYDGDDEYLDNRMDIGFQLGAGVLLADKFIIDIRYGLGFSNLADKTEFVDDAKSKNRVFQIGISMPLKLN